MSRVGRLPIAIPAGVTVTVAEGNVVTVKGPKGQLVKAMDKDMNIAVEDNHYFRNSSSYKSSCIWNRQAISWCCCS